MRVHDINEEIECQYDRNIERRISDSVLMPLYVKSPAVKRLSDTMDAILERRVKNMDARTRRGIKRDFLPFTVPPGVKSSIRGASFNKCIASILNKMCDDAKNTFKLDFEKKTKHTNEIADWIITIEGPKKKMIIGYNQLDLWNGGAQINRASIC